MTGRAVRALLRTLAVALLAVAIGAAALWPVGYTRALGAIVRVGGIEAGAASITGGAFVVAGRTNRPFAAASGVEWIDVPIGSSRPPPLDAEWLGFGYAVEYGEAYARAPAPAAILALLAASAGSWIAAGRLARRAGLTRVGVCPACGYDLRATPDRCPECGATAAP